MSTIKLAGVLALAVGVSGCIAPSRKDPFAGFDVSTVDPNLKAMKAGMIVSANTKEAIAYLSRRSGALRVLNPGASFDSDRFFERLGALLSRRFREVVKINAPQDAAAVGADIVVLLDVYAKAGNISGMKNEFQDKMIFLEPNGAKIDEAVGVGVTHVPFPAITTRLEAAAEEALVKLDAAIDASVKLKEFARSRTTSSVAAAPAPAAKARAAAIYSDVDAPKYSLPVNENLFAVVVGIENYANLPAAEFAERDAAAMKAHLIALGYPERNVIFLTGFNAGKAAMEKYIETWLPRNVKKDSRVFFYFSGHGAPDPTTGQAYLVPWDGDAKYLENTGYPISRLYKKLNALKTKKIVIAMDSCFSGTGGRSVLASGTRPLVNKVEINDGALDQLLVLSASAGDEISGTAPEQGHGLFTYHLLKGLAKLERGATGRSLHEYLSPLVRDAARRDNRDQTPQLLPAGAPPQALSSWAE